MALLCIRYAFVIVALRFLIPYSPSFNLLESTKNKIINTQSTITTNGNPSSENENISDSIPNTSNDYIASAEIQNKFSFHRIMSYLWIPYFLIALILFIKKIIQHKKFTSFISDTSVQITDSVLIRNINAVQENMKIQAGITLYENPLIVAPMMIGKK